MLAIMRLFRLYLFARREWDLEIVLVHGTIPIVLDEDGVRDSVCGRLRAGPASKLEFTLVSVDI